MRTLALVALVLAPALTGCIGVPAGDGRYALTPNLSTGAGLVDEAAALTRIDAPVTWSVGNYWKFDVVRTDGSNFAAGLVAYKEDATNVYLATDSRDYALRQAVMDRDLLLGAFTKKDLQRPSGFGTPKLFDFPLFENKTYSVTGYRGTFAVTARFVPDIPSPVGRSPGFEIMGRDGTGSTIRYNYVPAVKWFTRLEFSAPDGSIVFSRQLTEYRERFDGQYILMGARPLHEATITVTSAPEDSFQVSGADSLVFMGEARGTGAATVRVVTPGGAEAWNLQASGADFRVADMKEVPAETGDWKVASAVAGNGTASLRVLAVTEQTGRIV